jgi:hypothetical protein
MIEAALAKSPGKVAGPRAAAAKLGIPASTLESRIKQLGIEKRRFTTAFDARGEAARGTRVPRVSPQSTALIASASVFPARCFELPRVRVSSGAVAARLVRRCDQ